MDYVLWEDDRDEGEAIVRGGWPKDIGMSFFTGAPIKAPVRPSKSG